MSTKKIAYLSILIALSVVGRIYFGFVPNVQPTTVIIIITAIFLGARNGMTIAVLSAILSNLIMGMGIWTIGQVIAWAFIGGVSGLIGKKIEKIPFLIMAFYAGLTGMVYGFILSLFYFFIENNHFIAYYIAGVPFDLAHSIGNVVFYIILYPILSKLLKQFKVKEKVT
ncbi:ECF transporter S component [Bacillus sp. M6-12]|uniref:ECF transporter S component n=1 Tax=Bacillus sp. M6-12 TaxID=2054166 RepID=UPI000C78D17C|nr:ECF transporter S component [Bacillus sp. M6-12]PLS19031.1 ECF transporter S component [Bacillus sp. M6-12]